MKVEENLNEKLNTIFPSFRPSFLWSVRLSDRHLEVPLADILLFSTVLDVVKQTRNLMFLSMFF